MSDDLVLLGRYLDAVGAEIAKGVLDEEGIRVFVEGGTSTDLIGPMATGGVRLMVAAADLERAKVVLEEAKAARESGVFEPLDAEIEGESAEVLRPKRPEKPPEWYELAWARRARNVAAVSIGIPILLFGAIPMLLSRRAGEIRSEEARQTLVTARLLVYVAVVIHILVFLLIWSRGRE